MKEESKLKTGYFSSSNSREFREQYFSYNLSGGFDPNNPNSYLNDPAYLQYIATPVGSIRTNYSFARYISDTSHTPTPLHWTSTRLTSWRTSVCCRG